MVDPPYGTSSRYADITIKKVYASVPFPLSCDEIVVEPCGCSFLGLKRLKTCDGCLQRRLGP
ncbi:hypothetical protein LCGC14_1243890 [marine sediment metagenome]|uniref:Uncharacterized protein n=1 Tax=marine sediment metagenome TaxID=412755 RepID=A0A0F9L523_9ZZZZ